MLAFGLRRAFIVAAGHDDMRASMLGGWVSRLVIAFVVFCAIQFALVAYLRPGRADSSSSSSPSTPLLHDIVSSKTIGLSSEDDRDFGAMARKVAQMAYIAEEHTTAQSSTPAVLNQAVTNLFPWWRPENVKYYPWQTEADRLQAVNHDSDSSHDTGIVIGVGDGNVYTAATLISTLRKTLNSTLPIELAYVGDKDLSEYWKNYLCGLIDNINCYPIDLTKIFDNKLVNLQTYDTKPFAMLASRYQHTILVDADSTFFSAPDNAFQDHESLKKHGLLYFVDRSKYWLDGKRVPHEERLAWLAKQIKNAGRVPSSYLNSSSFLWAGSFVTEGMDSCVVFFDKGRPQNYFSLLFTAWMNAESGGRPEIYRHFHGDKETYWVAGELTGLPVNFEPWSAARFTEAPSALAYSDINHTTQLTSCTEHMVHSNGDGSEPWFANEGVFLNKNDPEAGFVNWTHWYLGEPVADALERSKKQLKLDPGASFFTPLDVQTKKDFAHEVLLHQPDWDFSCKQQTPEHWRPLPQDFRDRLHGLIDEAKKVQVSFRAKKKELESSKAARKKAEEEESKKPTKSPDDATRDNVALDDHDEAEIEKAVRLAKLGDKQAHKSTESDESAAEQKVRLADIP